MAQDSLDRAALPDASLSACGLGADQAFECVNRFRHDLRNLNERWNNRLVLERTSWCEAYIDGRLEIAMYGDRLLGADDENWLCCIRADIQASDRNRPERYIGPIDVRHGGRGDEQIMFVVVVEGVESPKRFIRSVIRSYLLNDKPLSTGNGLLYKVQDGCGYKVLPRGVDREVRFGRGIDRSQNACAEVIERRSEVVDRISDCKREHTRDGLNGPENESIFIDLATGRANITLYPQRVEFVGQRLSQSNQLVNVAVGPLNL